MHPEDHGDGLITASTSRFSHNPTDTSMSSSWWDSSTSPFSTTLNRTRRAQGSRPGCRTSHRRHDKHRFQGPPFARGYDSTTDCEFSDSGTPLRWGNPHKAVVTGAFKTHGWNCRLEFDMSPQAGWFIATPFYEHLSLPISGTASLSGESIPISGCVEYARCKAAPGAATRDHVQMARSCGGKVRNGFMPPPKFVHVRTVPDDRVHEEYTTELRVELLDDELVTDSPGRQTRMPRKFKASVVIGSGSKVLKVVGRVDTPLRDGAGRGFVGGYDAVVTYKGGGMFEWADLELQEQKANL
ncbi:hypothetical protein J3458_002070 [Metarhizium acridum]|uniref:uncharacterized protein n=1 Tax=Metarhizium acridum TaxID=92637 RepID=UPI001C6CFC55|nr:hypothetical protein J3458_002070 [Metarhizium acridum]